METDFLGARLDVTLIERVPEVVEYTLSESNGVPLSLADFTFEAVLVDSCGRKQDINAELVRKDVAAVFWPSLRVGAYRYELWARSDSGDRLLVSGRVGVMEAVRAVDFVRSAGERRRFDLHLPAVSGRRLRAEAIAGSAALAAARLAGDEYERAREEADRAAEQAQRAADEAVKLVDIDEFVARVKDEVSADVGGIVDKAADKLADDVAALVNSSMEELERKREELADTLEELDTLKERVKSIQEDIRGSLFIDSEGVLWIAGESTGNKITGEPGKSPYMDDDGYIHWYDDGAGAWRSQRIKADDGFSPYVNDRGYWVAADPITGEVAETPYRAYGVDGVDADTVIRHLVDSASDIPLSGDTCNGGHYYYVPALKYGANAKWTVDYRPSTAMMGGAVDGYLVLPNNPLYFMDERSNADIVHRINEDGYYGCTAKLDPETGKCIIYTDSNAVVYYHGGSDLFVEQIDGTETEGYDVYAWLVDPDGAAAWHKVDEKNDISSEKVYGLNKLGSDIVIVNGVPVGVNEHGQLSVPRATMETMGGVAVSTNETLGDGSIIGLNAAGQLVGARANVFDYGGVRLSTNETCEAEVVGLTIGGSLGVMFGGVGQPGVFAVTRTAAGDGAAEVGVDGNHNLRLSIDGKSPLYWDKAAGHVSLRIGSGITLQDGVMTIPQGDSAVYGLVKLDDSLTVGEAAATVASINAVLKYYAKDKEVVKLSSFNALLADALKSPDFEIVTTDDIKDFMTRAQADELYAPKKGMPVIAFTRYSDMPPIEDQEAGIIYLAPAP